MTIILRKLPLSEPLMIFEPKLDQHGVYYCTFYISIVDSRDKR